MTTQYIMTDNDPHFEHVRATNNAYLFVTFYIDFVHYVVLLLMILTMAVVFYSLVSIDLDNTYHNNRRKRYKHKTRQLFCHLHPDTLSPMFTYFYFLS